MAVKAYVLIEAAIGKISQVAEKVRSLPNVAEANVVAGPYDIIVIVQAEDAESVGKLVITQIHGIPGVNYTMTCIVIGG